MEFLSFIHKKLMRTNIGHADIRSVIYARGQTAHEMNVRVTSPLSDRQYVSTERSRPVAVWGETLSPS